MRGKENHFGRVVHFDNWAQLRTIRRYHAHLIRNRATVSLEEAARMWITNYAAMWRSHRDARRYLRCD